MRVDSFLSETLRGARLDGDVDKRLGGQQGGA